MANLALVRDARGRHSEAEALLRQVLARRRRVLGTEHPRVLGAMNDLGLMLSHQGKHVEAEPLLRECLEIRKAALPEGDWRTADTMSVLGVSLAGQGKHAGTRTAQVKNHVGDALRPVVHRRLQLVTTGGAV